MIPFIKTGALLQRNQDFCFGHVKFEMPNKASKWTYKVGGWIVESAA